MTIKPGIIGSGSWATALAKILTDNGHRVNWWIRNQATGDFIKKRGHNPRYIPSATLQSQLLHIHTDIRKVVADSNLIIIAIPSAFAVETLALLQPQDLQQKKILSAIKGMLPSENVLLNDWLAREFKLPLTHYFAVLGPCHAEEVAAEKLSYLTFSGIDPLFTQQIAAAFQSPAINTIVNDDILGVQYAAVLKNIYALGAGIAHGLDYGDNFLSVFIANAADEMAGFLRKFGASRITVGEHAPGETGSQRANYAASVYLGDLLVTCYSLHSRNRTFGNMIGKGYSVQAATLELNMVAEGYNASKCIYQINKTLHADMPIAENIYRILWEKIPPAQALKEIENVLI